LPQSLLPAHAVLGWGTPLAPLVPRWPDLLLYMPPA